MNSLIHQANPLQVVISSLQDLESPLYDPDHRSALSIKYRFTVSKVNSFES